MQTEKRHPYKLDLQRTRDGYRFTQTYATLEEAEAMQARCKAERWFRYQIDHNVDGAVQP